MQQTKTPKGGRNLSTSETRKHKYASYKSEHGSKQHSHSAPSKRSPLVRHTQRRVEIGLFVEAYKEAVRKSTEGDEMPVLPLSRQTRRMIGELKAMGNYPMVSRTSKRG